MKAAKRVLSPSRSMNTAQAAAPLGPDRKFGLWDGDIWSSENSQRVADAYSFSHIVHDILFYALLWVAARRLPLRYRFLRALMLEAGWEVLENSPFIINRYREATIALGYVGDSLLNSCSDIAMMAFGSVLAVVSAYHYHLINQAIDRGDVGANGPLAVTVAVAVALLGLTMIGYILLTVNGL